MAVFSKRPVRRDVLLALEREFANQKVQDGLKWVDNQTKYNEIKHDLILAVNIHRGKAQAGAEINAVSRRNIEQLDAVLHFYLLLNGIRTARQFNL